MGPRGTLAFVNLKCNAHLILPDCAVAIDSSGFESFGLDCKHCGAPLAGIMDPADDKLLLTVLTEE